MVRRGHVVRVVTQMVAGAGLPRDEVIDGLTVHRWVEPIRRGPLFGLSFVAGVVGALRRLRGEIDLIHTHQALWESVAAGIARPLAGVPTLIQPASSGYFGEAEEMARTKGFPLLRRIATRNSAFAAISRDIERQWLSLGVPTERMHRMASGVDTTRFHPGPSLVEEERPPRPRVVFTGRLHPQKNLEVLLDAWARVVPDAAGHLLLLGDGPDRDRLGRRARELGIADRTHFLGAVADPAEDLRAADLFVLPSVAEGMSNSLLEAMATGLPCLASDIGGNRDLLAEGPCGLLLTPDDPSAWASAIGGLLRDPARGRDLGAKALHRIREEFALDVVVDRYERLYERLLAAP